MNKEVKESLNEAIEMINDKEYLKARSLISDALFHLRKKEGVFIEAGDRCTCASGKFDRNLTKCLLCGLPPRAKFINCTVK